MDKGKRLAISLTAFKELQYRLQKEGHYHIRALEINGEIKMCSVHRMIFTTAVTVGVDNKGNYEGRYCYNSFWDATRALKEWDGQGDPPGPWIKYKGEGGERRRPFTPEEISQAREHFPDDSTNHEHMREIWITRLRANEGQ
jgi:hypothetical protein